MNQNMPMSSLQLIMQMAAQNPKLIADMMANTGAQPPVPMTPQGTRATGVPAMGATPTAQASGNTSGISPSAATVPMGTPAPVDTTQLSGGMSQLGQALAGAQQPTVAPGPETISPPSAPQPLQASGQIGGGNIAQMMQMLMAAQQKPTDRLSLGRAIAGG